MSDKGKIEDYINSAADWQQEVLKKIRNAVVRIDENIIEEWKWNCPVWSLNKPICAAGKFKKHIKLNFFNGAAIENDKGYFNSGFESKKSRSINYSSLEDFDTDVVKYLVQQAMGLNT